MNYFNFEVIAQSTKSRARVGKIYTPHGVIDTPNFVAVGTNGTLKLVDNTIVNQLSLQLMFCNTYHLIVHPGPDIISQAGGLHEFINRPGPIITDSGGFQVFSLAYGTVKEEIKSKGTKKHTEAVIKITEEGVLFRSYRDGSPILLTPESSIQAQKKLGADIIVPFDELPPYHIDPNILKKSVERTHRWEERSLNEHLKNKQNQAIYAVVHGGINPELRKLSVDFLSKLPFDGFAIGGSVGKNQQEMFHMLNFTVPLLPKNKPNHLLGIGDLASFEQCIKTGIDTFDSSHPTKSARHGLLFCHPAESNSDESSSTSIKIIQGKYKADFKPIDINCQCLVCQNYTRSYIHHLFKAKEMTGLALATIHNLYFTIKLMENYRSLILEDRI